MTINDGSAFRPFRSLVVVGIAFFLLAANAVCDVLIDDGDVGTSFTGTWYPSGGTSPNDGDSLWSRNGATYTWQFDSTEPAGTYEVLMWWSGWPSRGSDIVVDINHSGGTENLRVNQQQDAGQWNSLGTYFFDSSGSVRITAATGTTVSTCADAVWFRSVSTNAPPVASIDIINPNPAEPLQFIEFQGSGTDSEGAIVDYRWESSLDGFLSDLPSFSMPLTEGTHTISFTVQDEEGVWSAPATQLLVVGAIPTEIVIDNRDPETARTGTWAVSGAPNPYGTDSVWSRDGTTFRWDFIPPQAGNYEVSLWWTQWSSRSSAVPVTIVYDGGSTTQIINQQTNGGQWNSLGIYHFDPAAGGRVSIVSQPGPSSTCADAVRFNLTQTNDPPTAVIDAILPNPAEPGDLVTFTGYGEDADGTVVASTWTSSINGVLSNEDSFSTTTLSLGVHTITFQVQDNGGEWSAPATATLAVGNAAPSAYIDSISPNPAIPGENVVFQGHGTDVDGIVTGCSWESDIDGHLSAVDSFSTNTLSIGDHTITFRVYDDRGEVSQPVTQTLTVEVIPTVLEMDNGGDGTFYTGSWYVSGASDFYGTNSLWSRDGATYTWTFEPAVSSNYEIFMWWTQWPSRSTSVPVAIEYATGTTTVYVNQQTNGGQWNSLGAYFFQAGNSYHVTITAQPGPSSTCADAVRFVETTAPVPTAPVADFSADRTSSAENSTIQFYDHSSGNVQQWLWDFGDGATSTGQNPSHLYAAEGQYTVSLTVTNAVGSDTITRLNYIAIASNTENIYICDGYSNDGLIVPWSRVQLTNLGATQHNPDFWEYTNIARGITYYIRFVYTPEGMLAALREEGSHVIYNGHSNYGLGAVFATAQETATQTITAIRYVDDDRILNISTDMVSLKVDGMQSGQAYPNWLPIFHDGTSALMPYDFSEGTPPYNYYLTYSPPGDSNVYKVELADGSYLERFPDSRVPAWDFSIHPNPPSTITNQEYFITNPGDEFNHVEYTGNWTMGGDCKADDAECMGYNYHYSAPGSGADVATYYFVINTAGNYRVQASWEASASNASNAKYTITHSGGTDTVEANQRVSTGGGYVTLDTFYFDVGYYTVELNDDANGTVIADAVVLVPADNPDDVVMAEFRANTPTSGGAPLTVEFDDRSYASQEIVSYYWQFGDGATSTEEDTSHTYTTAGNYTVRLTVTDALSRTHTEVKQNFVAVGTAAPVHAEFTQTSRFAELGTSVYFYDQSSGDINSWSWNFGDGNTSSEQNPRHVYDTPGVYTVRLTVSGPGGSDVEEEVDYIYAITESSYTDNSYLYKSHFVSRSGATSTFGKVVVDVSSAVVPTNDLRYSRFFYASCNSGNYYIGKFHRGIMFFTISDQTSYNAHHYLRNYLLGWSDQAILNDLNRRLDIYEYYDFNQVPPSMR